VVWSQDELIKTAELRNPRGTRPYPYAQFAYGSRVFREALGVEGDGPLVVQLLLDRSASAQRGDWDGQDFQSLGQLGLAEEFIALENDDGRNDYRSKLTTAVAITGFNGGNRAEIYEFKAFGRMADRALCALPTVSGGGTTTAATVEYATAKMDYIGALQATEAVKLIVVVAAGRPRDIDAAGKAVDAARAQGIRVIGVCKGDDWDEKAMVEQFGDEWITVDGYETVGRKLTDYLHESKVKAALAASAAPAKTSTGAPTQAQQMGDTVLALSEGAAREFAAAHRDSSDPNLQLCSLYVSARLRDPGCAPETALAAAEGYQRGVPLPTV
jgi:hypothetical protein